MTGPEDTTRPERVPDPHRVEHELDPRDVADAYDVLEIQLELELEADA